MSKKAQVPEYIYLLLAVYQKIANDLILNFEAKHIKTIYWTGKGKDYRWIAQNVFQDKVLEGTVRNYMWEVGKVFKKYVI